MNRVRSHYSNNDSSYATATHLIIMVAVLGVLGFIAVDKLTSKVSKHGYGRITSKQYYPESTITIPGSCTGEGDDEACTGDTDVNVPEHWTVCVAIDDGNACSDVSENDYNALSVNQRVLAYYDVGGITGTFYLTSIQPL